MIRARALAVVDINLLGTALVLTAIGFLLIYSATYFTDPGLQTGLMANVEMRRFGSV